MWKRTISKNAEAEEEAGRSGNEAAGRDYDRLIKTSLSGHLGEAVREVQRQQARDASMVVESSSETAHGLCCVLEALFVHKLKDSIVAKVSSVFSGSVQRQPAPNFWPFLSTFSHRHSIDYLLGSCSWLKTDIGRCRGWIRTVLNDGMLTSYLELLGLEKRLLNDFYEPTAYLRDPEHLDIARKLLSGIDQLEFQLAVNSSMLNQWSSTPLMLAGVWAPPTAIINPMHEAVVQGVDAALCFTDEDETLQPLKNRSPDLPTPAAPTVDADLAFQLILDSNSTIPAESLLPRNADLPWTPPVQLPSPPPRPQNDAGSVPQDPNLVVTHLKLKNSRTASPIPPTSDPSATDSSAVDPATSDRAASDPATSDPAATDPFSTEAVPISDRTLLAATTYDETQSSIDAASIDTGQQTFFSDTPIVANSSCTFEDLLENYSPMAAGMAASYSPEPLERSASSSSSALVMVGRLDSLDEPEFEMVGRRDEQGEHDAAYRRMLATINNEKGLLKQNYRCLDCSRPIGCIYGPAKTCSFTGGSYCSDCHVDDESLIPARVFYNGDFSRRRICQSVNRFLNRIQADPILDATQFSRSVYKMQRQLGSVLVLRTRLHHLAAYLDTCRSSDAGAQLRKRIWPREYLFEKLHFYALTDLLQVQSGQLEQQLSRLFQWGRGHVTTCHLCSLKGFVCEACRHSDRGEEAKPSVLFSFDLESTYRCSVCGALFHSTCMDDSKDCPRCLRWSQTQPQVNVDSSNASSVDLNSAVESDCV